MAFMPHFEEMIPSPSPTVAFFDLRLSRFPPFFIFYFSLHCFPKPRISLSLPFLSYRFSLLSTASFNDALCNVLQSLYFQAVISPSSLSGSGPFSIWGPFFVRTIFRRLLLQISLLLVSMAPSGVNHLSHPCISGIYCKLPSSSATHFFDFDFDFRGFCGTAAFEGFFFVFLLNRDLCLTSRGFCFLPRREKIWVDEMVEQDFPARSQPRGRRQPPSAAACWWSGKHVPESAGEIIGKLLLSSSFIAYHHHILLLL